MNRKNWFCAFVLLALCFTCVAEEGEKTLRLTSKDIDTALKTFTEIRKLNHHFEPGDVNMLQATATIKEIETLLKKNYEKTELFSQHLSAIAGSLAYLQSEKLLKEMQKIPQSDLPASAVALLKEQENNFRKALEEQLQGLNKQTVDIVKERQDEIMKIFQTDDDDDDDDDGDDDDDDGDDDGDDDDDDD